MTELALMAFGLDPFGEAERVLKGTLEDPNIDVATKTWVLALLSTVDPPRLGPSGDARYIRKQRNQRNQRN